MCWRPSDWLSVLFCRWVDRRRHFWKPSSTLSIFIHCHCHWSFVSILQWFLLSSAITALTVFVTRFSFLWCQLSWSTQLFLSFTTDHWRRITESVVSASAPKQRVYVQVRSPLAAVVVMIGAKEEVRWSYKRGRGENITFWHRRPLFVFSFLLTVNSLLMHDHDRSQTLTEWLLL